MPLKTQLALLVFLAGSSGVAVFGADEPKAAPSTLAVNNSAGGLIGIAQGAAAGKVDYSKLILADKPAAYWRMGDTTSAAIVNIAPTAKGIVLDGSVHGKVTANTGPRPDPGDAGHIDFEPSNAAAEFDGKGGYIAVTDPGEASPLDFDLNQAITLEAWVNPNEMRSGQHYYIVGKGRTGRPGQQANNQNYALRLTAGGSVVKMNFLFHDSARKEKGKQEADKSWHRWTTKDGFAADSGWHHVAVTYTFGKGDSVRGYIDGKELKGEWDMGGKTDLGPIVDNDELWIGSSMAGAASATFRGGIDEVAIYRTALSAKQIAAHYHYITPAPWIDVASLPAGKVNVQIIEKIPERAWSDVRKPAVESWEQDLFAFPSLPHKYNEKGVIADRAGPFLIRAASMIELPAGRHRLLLRSLNGSRLSVDGRVVTTTSFIPTSTDAHHSVPDPATAAVEGMRAMGPGHSEQVVNFESAGGRHLFVLESHVGGAKLRQETGELSVAIAGSEGMFHLLGPRADSRIPLTDDDWSALAAAEKRKMAMWDVDRRRVASKEEDRYWTKRHELTRQFMQSIPAPIVTQPKDAGRVKNDIDKFINAELENRKVAPAPLTDDYAFLRRVTLDTVGMLPSPQEIESFMADAPEMRRANVIEKLLADKRWADHWVPYWQDVLAENPGILKPELNNTGPFRFWIHESFSDNKSIDRFASELIGMSGSVYYGGPAGFSLATDNDVPMAEKAHVVGEAFLGVEMKCARCHDAPYHDVKQKDLFSIAAMLKQTPMEVPMTSSIPGGKARLRKMIVEVTLEPGSKVEPSWPFAQFAADSLPEGIIRDPENTRDRLAALVTWPANQRFASVIANRMWKRYMNFGIVEPIEDWEKAKPSHPLLLEYLARELVMHDYDLKRLARLILNSDTYQRAILDERAVPLSKDEHLFASPVRRRMTAEQLVDSLFALAGKPMDGEELNIDVDGRLSVSTFMNLGTPSKSWQMASTSNERDRPALALPKDQSILDVLKEFGWRESRQNPLNCRELAPTVQQPAILANGILMRRIVSLSDNSAFTSLALAAKTPEDLVEALFLRILNRGASSEEVSALAELLAEGFEARVKTVKPTVRKQTVRQNVSWSNHLSAEATLIKQEIEKQVRAGDPPTERLDPAWRARVEDVVWAMINTPEFMFVP